MIIINIKDVMPLWRKKMSAIQKNKVSVSIMEKKIESDEGSDGEDLRVCRSRFEMD